MFPCDLKVLEEFFESVADPKNYQKDKKEQSKKSLISNDPGSISSKAIINPAIKAPDPVDRRTTEENLDREKIESQKNKITPDYEFIYKQNVTCADAFLGLSMKDPSSICCELMVIKIYLPLLKKLDTSVKLDVKSRHLKFESPDYKLFTYLPYDVDFEKGNAKFNKDTKYLIIDVPIIRPNIQDVN